MWYTMIKPRRKGLARIWVVLGAAMIASVLSRSSGRSQESLRIVTGPLYAGYLDEDFDAVLSAAGGSSPYHWRVESGTLPQGLSVGDRDGRFHGKTKQAGQFTFSVGVTDHSNNSATKKFGLTIFEHPLDAYGGLSDVHCSGGRRPHFYAEKSDQRWHLCTPAGNRFWLSGVFYVSAASGKDYQGIDNSQLVNSKYVSGPTAVPTLNWAYQSLLRLRAWGFNGEGEYSSVYTRPTHADGRWPTPDHTIPIRLPYTLQLNPILYSAFNLNGYAPGPVKNTRGLCKLSVLRGGTKGMADILDPNYAAWLRGDLRRDPPIKESLTGPHNDYLLAVIGDEADVVEGFLAGRDFQTIERGHLNEAEGKASLHEGWVTLISAPTETACPKNQTPGGRSPQDVIFTDTEFHTKTDFAAWLQGKTEPARIVSASRRRNVVTLSLDANPFVSGDVITVRGTTDRSFESVPGKPFEITSVNGSAVSYAQGGPEASSAGGNAASGPGYTLEALNAAWGSNYNSFGSDATPHRERCAQGNGSAGPYTCTLQNSGVAPLTVQVTVGDPNRPAGGDDGAGPKLAEPNDRGTVIGPGMAYDNKRPISTINYSSGALSLVFAQPVRSGEEIVVSYQTQGWGQGHGVLDEDGTCPSRRGPKQPCWVPRDDYALAGAPAAMKADLDNYLFHFCKAYCATMKGEIEAAAPGVMYAPLNPLGSWGTPPRAPVLRAAAAYLDLFGSPSIPAIDPKGQIPDTQARIDFIARYLGDKPWITWEGFYAQPDSYLSPYPKPFFDTQVERGHYYRQMIDLLLDTHASPGCQCSLSDTHPLVGMLWWAYYDSWREKTNWGLATPRDDPYDGVAATTSPGVDRWGYPTGCLPQFGCEQANYGDFLDSAVEGNLAALRKAAGER